MRVFLVHWRLTISRSLVLFLYYISYYYTLLYLSLTIKSWLNRRSLLHRSIARIIILRHVSVQKSDTICVQIALLKIANAVSAWRSPRRFFSRRRDSAALHWSRFLHRYRRLAHFVVSHLLFIEIPSLHSQTSSSPPLASPACRARGRSRGERSG